MKTMETVETKKAKHTSRRFRRFARANEAVSALEYAILVGVIAVAIGVALTTFSGPDYNGDDHYWRQDWCHHHGRNP